MESRNELFKRVGDYYLFDDINLEKEIAIQYGTPTYVFSTKKIKENIRDLKQSFQKTYPNTSIAYSMKNNYIPEICSVIASEIDTFEITSLTELKIVEKIVFNQKRNLNLILTNIYKSDSLIDKTIHSQRDSNTSDYNDPSNLIAIDSYQDLKNVERIAKKVGKKARVLIRVNPGIKMDIRETIFASANISAKCASIIADIEPIIEASNDPTISIWLPKRETTPRNDFAEKLVQEAINCKHLELVGLHGHLGSQITNIEYFDRFFEVISRFYKLMNEKYDDVLEILDLGGGYPVDYSNSGGVPTIEDISKVLTKNIRYANIKPDLIIESGRYITASSGLLLSKVCLTKENSEGKNLAVLDLSVYSDLLDVLAANWCYDAVLINNLTKQIDKNKGSCWTLVGGTNDTLDQLTPRSSKCSKCDDSLNGGIERCFPKELKTGDLLAIKNAGAYTTCFNSNYSGRPIPTKILIAEDQTDRIQLL